MAKISVSLLSMRDNLLENVKKLNDTDIDYIHLDIMDKIFVQEESYNYDEIKLIVSNTNKPLDVHLMVRDIDTYINHYNMYNTEYLTFHYEAMLDTKIIKKIKSYGIKCGISVKPNTEIEQIYDLLDQIDMVLIMSVEPGKGGQIFIPTSLEKIKKLKEEITKRGLNVLISVDGGINNNTIEECIKYGTDILVIGSYFNKCNDINKVIKDIKSTQHV